MPRKKPSDAFPHLAGGLVRKSDGKDRLGVDAHGDQMSDSVRNGFRFPGTRSGDDKQRPFVVQNCLFLGFVEPF
ncbi:hypothetical protein D3C83_168890 [compost metagenome]